ncbi:MAG: acyl-homoserine-lactone synthase [Caulobacteraceae bacterium]
MIHLVDQTNRHLYGADLQAMHRQRHEHFVVDRGWRDLHSDGGLETDAYDDEKAMYLLAVTSDDEVAVSARIRMAQPSGLIADHFSHLVADGVVSGPGIFECTRYLVAPAFRGPAGFGYRSKLHLAILELMHDLAGKRLLGFTDLQLVMHMRQVSGLQIRPVGMPADYEEGTALAFEFLLGAGPLAHCRESLGLTSHQLFKAPAWLSDRAAAKTLEVATSVLASNDAQLQNALGTSVQQLALNVCDQPNAIDIYAAMLAKAN